METLHILQQSEFQVLAAAVGFTNIYGIRSDIEIDETAVMYGIHEMVQKGILKPIGDNFEISEPLKSAFLNLRDATSILAATGIGERKDNACFYIGEKIISVEESSTDKNAVKIGIYERTELYECLLERGFLPEPFVEEDIACMQPEEEMLSELPGESIKDIASTDQLDLSGANVEEAVAAQYLCIYPKEAREVKKAFYLINNSCNYWIAQKDADSIEFAQYNPDELYERVTAVLR